MLAFRELGAVLDTSNCTGDNTFPTTDLALKNATLVPHCKLRTQLSDNRSNPNNTNISTSGALDDVTAVAATHFNATVKGKATLFVVQMNTPQSTCVMQQPSVAVGGWVDPLNT